MSQQQEQQEQQQAPIQIEPQAEPQDTLPEFEIPSLQRRKRAVEYVAALSRMLEQDKGFSVPEEAIRKQIKTHFRTIEEMLAADEHQASVIEELQSALELSRRELEAANRREEDLKNSLAELRRESRTAVTEGGEQDVLKLKKRRKKKEEPEQEIDPFDDPDAELVLPEHLRTKQV